MSSRPRWKVAQVATVLQALALLASCGQQTEQETAALAQEVESLKQRVAQLEQPNTGTDVEAVKAELQTLAATVGQLAATVGQLAPPPTFDEARVAAVAERQVAATVQRSIGRLRAELNDMRAMVDSIAARAARNGQPQAGAERPEPQQKMTPEQKMLRKTEQIARKANLTAEQVQALGKIRLANWQDVQQIKQKIKAKEITKEESRQAMKEARRKYTAAMEPFLAGLDAQQRETLENELRSEKRKKKTDGKRKKRGKKKEGQAKGRQK